jgi:hypothetical protein
MCLLIAFDFISHEEKVPIIKIKNLPTSSWETNDTRDRFKEETKYIAILYCEGVQFGPLNQGSKFL